MLRFNIFVVILVILANRGHSHIKRHSKYVVNIRGSIRSELGFWALRKWKGTRDSGCSPLMFVYMLADAYLSCTNKSFVRIDISDFLFGRPDGNETHVWSVKNFSEKMLSEFDRVNYKVYYDMKFPVARKFQWAPDDWSGSATAFQKKPRWLLPVPDLGTSADDIVRAESYSGLRLRKLNHFALKSADLIAVRGFKFLKYWLKPFEKEFHAIFFGEQHRHKEVFMQVAARFRVGNSTLLGAKVVLLKVRRWPHRYVHVYIIIPRRPYAHYTVARKMYSYPEAINNMTWTYLYINLTIPYIQLDHIFYDGRKPFRHFGLKALYTEGVDGLLADDLPIFLTQSLQRPAVIFGKSYISAYVDHFDIGTTNLSRFLEPELEENMQKPYTMEWRYKMLMRQRRRKRSAGRPGPEMTNPTTPLTPSESDNWFRTHGRTNARPDTHNTKAGIDIAQEQRSDTRPRMGDTYPRKGDNAPHMGDTERRTGETHSRMEDTHPRIQDTHSRASDTRSRLVYKRSRMHSKQPRYRGTKPSKQASIVVARRTNARKDHAEPPNARDYRRSNNKDPNVWKHRWKEQWSVVCKVMCTTWNKCPDKCYGSVPKTTTPVTRKVYKMPPTWNRRRKKKCRGCRAGPTKAARTTLAPGEYHPRQRYSSDSMSEHPKPMLDPDACDIKSDLGPEFAYMKKASDERKQRTDYENYKPKRVTVNHPFIFLVTVNQEQLFSAIYV